MCAGQVHPLQSFCSEYEAPELGVAGVVVATLAVVAVNVRENHASQIHTREAGSWMETMAYDSPHPWTEGEYNVVHAPPHCCSGSASLRLSSFIGLKNDFSAIVLIVHIVVEIVAFGKNI